MQEQYKHKLIRDPLYGLVGLSKTEDAIINTAAFQRLRHIKQLGFTYLHYPSGVHTRFEHALGVTHLADRMSRQLELSDDMRKIIRLCSLLHDIGHGPFSHAFERVLKEENNPKIKHDDISKIIIKYDPEITEILGDNLREQIIEVLYYESTDEDSSEIFLAHQIISGALDADRMDYLQRDSYHLGVKYGLFDLERIINTISCTKTETPGGTLYVNRKGIYAVENCRLARYLMFAQVYNHHRTLLAEEMYYRAVSSAIAENTISSEDFKVNDDAEFVKSYIGFDDNSIYNQIVNKGENNIRSANMFKNILQRKLPTRIGEIIDVENLINEKLGRKILRKQQTGLSNSIADHTDMEKDDVAVVISNVTPDFYDGSLHVYYRGEIKSLQGASPLPRKAKMVTRVYVYGPDNSSKVEQIRNSVRSLYHTEIEEIEKPLKSRTIGK